MCRILKREVSQPRAQSRAVCFFCSRHIKGTRPSHHLGRDGHVVKSIGGVMYVTTSSFTDTSSQ